LSCSDRTWVAFDGGLGCEGEYDAGPESEPNCWALEDSAKGENGSCLDEYVARVWGDEALSKATGESV
jgi:hypothetical protein